MENYSQELNDTLNEAMNVRIELETIMEEAVQISSTIVDEVEKTSLPQEITAIPSNLIQLNESENIPEEILIAPMADMNSIAEVDCKKANKPSKIRIYELARELQMSSTELLKLIKSLGINVNSHMNSLNERQLRLVKQAIDFGLRTEQDSKITGSDPVSNHDSNKSRPEACRLDLIVDNESLTNEDYAAFISNGEKTRQLEEQPALSFSMDELKEAHPYIAVKTLYDNGYQVREIAKILGRGQGEVNLIINLAKKKAAVM